MELLAQNLELSGNIIEESKLPFTVLVVDDDEDDLELIAEASAEACNCTQLKFLHDGREFLEYLSATDVLPDLILLDPNVLMPNGLDVIQNDPRLKDIPILILSSYDAEETIIPACFNCANPFVNKPLLRECFTEIINIIKNYRGKNVFLPTQTSPAERGAYNFSSRPDA